MTSARAMYIRALSDAPAPVSSARRCLRLVRTIGVPLVYVALVLWSVFQVAAAYDVSTGFTSLIWFGDRFESSRLHALQADDVFAYPDSGGYDGQLYAQIAVSGNPFDRELRNVLDLPAYRTRRILLPLIAHLLGGGRPIWILNVYALSNLLCWITFGILLARWWLPPRGGQDLLRWVGIMFGAGMLGSVSRSLTDAPAALLIAVGVRLIEVNRRGWAAAVIGAAGLVRESSILAASALTWSKDGTKAGWLRGFGLATVAVLPALAWMVIVARHFRSLDTGPITPFVGVDAELHRIVTAIKTHGPGAATPDLLVLVSACCQATFLLVRRTPASPWWRVGVAFSCLLILGDAYVWADPLSAVTRATLPLTIAFNLLVPRTRRGLAILLVGNLTVVAAPSAFAATHIARDKPLDGITCEYASGFHSPEILGTRRWRWTSGSARVLVRNSRSADLVGTFEFDVQSVKERTIEASAAGVARTVTIHPGMVAHVSLGPLSLRRGINVVAVLTNEPPWTEPGPDGRSLAFSIENLALVPASGRPAAGATP